MAAERTVRYIGIARKAGHLVIGTPAVCDALRRVKDGAVFTANDISDGTRKRIADKCAFYGAQMYCLPTGGAELAHAVGKTGAVAAVMITDAGLTASAVKAFVAETDSRGIE